jgi:hypothetical protein
MKAVPKTAIMMSTTPTDSRIFIFNLFEIVMVTSLVNQGNGIGLDCLQTLCIHQRQKIRDFPFVGKPVPDGPPGLRLI